MEVANLAIIRLGVVVVTTEPEATLAGMLQPMEGCIVHQGL